MIELERQTSPCQINTSNDLDGYDIFFVNAFSLPSYNLRIRIEN